jgi:hypothetical protein
MKKLLSVLILSVVFMSVVPMQVSALPVMNMTLDACDSIVVTNTNSYTETFDDGAGCWNLTSGPSNWSVNPFGYIYHQFGNYTCHAISPILDISAVTNPHLSFYQMRPDYEGSGVGDQLSIYYRNMSAGADSSWVLLNTYTNVVNSWAAESFPLPSGLARIQLKFTAVGMGNVANGCRLDNVSVYSAQQQDCSPVEQLTVVNVTDGAVDLSWYGVSDYGFIVRYKADNDTIWRYIDTTQNTSMHIHHLLPLTQYTAEVSAVCDSMIYTAVTFSTPMHSANLPYSTDFSSTVVGEWELINGNCFNQWKIGNPANLLTNSALFVTSDGVNALYDSTHFSVVSARKIFNTGNSEIIRLSFDVQIGGESYFDFLKVFVAPADVEYPAATSSVNYAKYNYSVNAFDFSEYLSQTGSHAYPYKLNLTNGVLHVEDNFANPVPGGQFQVVFLWANDETTGTPPSVAISNVHVSEMLCASPSNLTAAIVTSQSATIVWESSEGANGYILQYKPSSLSWDDPGVVSVNLENSYFSVTGTLTPNTDYDVRVATDCGADTSIWATTTFTTICGVMNVTNELPFMESFSVAPACWNLNAGAEAWPYDQNAGILHHLYGTYKIAAISPILNVSSVTNPMLRFSQKRPDYEGSAIADTMFVYYRSVHVTSDTSWHLLRAYPEYMNVWTEDSLILPHGLATIQLRFMVHGAGYDADGCYLDNVMVYNGTAGVCPPVVQLAAQNMTSTSALVTWTGFSENGYVVRYKEEGATSWIEWGTTNNMEALITNLLPGYQYTVEVSSNCTVMDYATLSFTTPLVAESLPFFTDFSNVAVGDWQLNNGTCTNHWVIGTPNEASNAHALFISPDGTNAEYNPSAYSIVSARKLFEAGQAESFLLSFDVQAGGESHYDYLKVFLSPDGVEYPASTTGTTYAASNYSTYAADFSDYLYQTTGNQDFVYKLNLTNGNVLHVTLEMPNPAPGGQMQLVFLWRNDDATGVQPGAIISNVSLMEQTCHRPTDLVASNVGVTTATLTWNGEDADGLYILQYKPAGQSWDSPGVTNVSVTGTSYVISSGLTQNTEYEVRVATNCENDTSTWCATTFTTECGVVVVTNSIPFEEDFVTYPDCWDLTSGSSAWNYSAHGQFIYHNYGVYTCDAISPMLDISAVTNPYFKCSHRHPDHSGSGVTDSVNVYYRTSPTAPWVLIHSCAGPMVTWETDSMALPNPTSTYQIKITAIGMGNEANGCSVNDIFVYNLIQEEPTVTTLEARDITQTSAVLVGAISNPDNMAILSQGFEWRATGDTYTQVSATGDTMMFNLTGLSQNTSYKFRAYVTTANGTHYGNDMIFTTLAPCDAPTGLDVVRYEDGALTITWDDADVLGWNLHYRQEGDSYSSATSATNSYVIEDVLDNVTYIIRVQAICYGNELSEWSDSLVVLTNSLSEYLNNGVLVYPNPANDYLNVQITNEDIHVTSMEVYDVYGKLITVVGANNYSPLQTRINVSGLANGMYFVRVTTEQGILTKPFVKK